MSIPEIHRFITAYVVAEDRLRFSCTLSTGDTSIFWVTQRLANPLAKALLDWLDKTVPDERFADFTHRAAQQSAAARKPKGEPLKIPEGAGWLVDAIDLKFTEKGIMLTFKDASGEQMLNLRFDPEHLRRWIKVLHAQYARSGWPMDLWPAWITEDSEPSPTEQPGLLH